MKFKKIFLPVFFLLIKTILFAQTSAVVFEEHFDNNENGWKLSISPADQAQIINGKLSWQHNNPDGSSISTYVNKLNTNAEFSVQAKFEIKKIGSEYGLMFAGT